MMRRLGFSLVAACLATAMAVAGSGAARAAPAIQHAPGTATVSVDISGPAIGQLVQHFIGLSVESGVLRTRAPQLRDTGNLARLLANLGALWVIDYLLTGAEHGVHAMNLDTGLSTACTTYTVLCLHGDNEYSVQPVYYGLLLTRMLGTGRLVPVRITQTPRKHITAFAERSDGGGLRLMVENLDSAAAAVTLDLGSYRGTATASRLRAPSLLATSGVTIQGTPVATDGSFSPGKPDTIGCAAAGCPLTMPGYSAALVTVPVG